MHTELPDLWVCPKCGAELVTRNMSHACGTYDLDTLFSRSEPHVRQLYDRYAEIVQSIGPVTIIPQKSRMVFSIRVRFAGATPRKSALIVHFNLRRLIHSPRFEKVEQYTRYWYTHYLRVESEDQFDEEFVAWMHESYELGRQKYLME